MLQDAAAAQELLERERAARRLVQARVEEKVLLALRSQVVRTAHECCDLICSHDHDRSRHCPLAHALRKGTRLLDASEESDVPRVEERF